MSPPRFTYRKLTAEEFTTELRQQEIPIKTFARLFGIHAYRVEKWATGKEEIPSWVPVTLTLLRLPKALGTARLAASVMIQKDRLRPELGEQPFFENRELPNDFDADDGFDVD